VRRSREAAAETEANVPDLSVLKARKFLTGLIGAPIAH
jgi:hypothetical protein